jgi:hypothetical protein
MKDNKFDKISIVETSKAESKNIFLKFWQDSVFSQLIAAGILISLPILSAIIVKFLDGKSISDFFINFLRLQIELYLLLLIAFVIILLYFIFLKYFQKNKKAEKYFLDKNVGDYRFSDLNNILLTTYIELPSPLNHQVGMKELDLLTTFRLFISQLSFGINWDHPTPEGDFLHYNLGPKLMSYGLCEKIPSIDNNTDGNINSYTIQTSENGHKFFALLESYDRIYNITGYEKEIAEKQKIKNEIAKKK